MSAEAKAIAFNIIKAVEGCSCDDCLDKAAKIIARAIMAERVRATAEVKKWKRRDYLSLHVGEVTAQEFRTVVAVLISIEAAIRSHPKKLPSGEAS